MIEFFVVITVLVIFAVTAALMICGILFFPEIKLGKLRIGSYWVITVVGAAVMALCNIPDAGEAFASLAADTAVNPLKILVLFISMTLISVFLDELGFFRFLAAAALKRARTGQKKLFIYLYVTVSVLTVFTSNDVIILSFTPFICYFSKNAGINPMPYLAAEFVAANTWSMALIIGNPTNIYLATAYGLDFVTYLKISILPTLFAGIASFLCMWIMFRKKLAEPIKNNGEEVVIEDKFLLWVGVAHLAVCTVLLAVGQYIGIEMWIVALASAGSLFLFVAVTSAVRRNKPLHLINCVRRAPWQLVPFVLSMFIMIVLLEKKGVTGYLAEALSGEYSPIKYGVASFLASNVINNIPMSVLFSTVAGVEEGALFNVFATVIGSNLGAFLTPVGALAGIMWSSLLNDHGLKFGYLDFVKTCAPAAIPALFAAIGGLYVSMFFV